MNPSSLNALILDRELGELPPEAVELLDAWLAEHPESAGDVARIQRTLDTAQAALHRFPELARPEPSARAEPEVIPLPGARFRLLPLALAASLLLLFGSAGWLGFIAGRRSEPNVTAQSKSESAPAAPANTVKTSGPWARYALAVDPRGRLLVVRRDSNTQP